MDHGAWLRYCFKSMTNRVGDLCDISTGPNPLFPPSETATTSEADDRPEGKEEEEEEPISEASSDEDVEEIEEPVPLQVESVAHRLVNKSSIFSTFLSFSSLLWPLFAGAERRINTRENKKKKPRRVMGKQKGLVLFLSDGSILSINTNFFLLNRFFFSFRQWRLLVVEKWEMTSAACAMMMFNIECVLCRMNYTAGAHTAGASLSGVRQQLCFRFL